MKMNYYICEPFCILLVKIRDFVFIEVSVEGEGKQFRALREIMQI